jgi:hypothetical protein
VTPLRSTVLNARIDALGTSIGQPSSGGVAPSAGRRLTSSPRAATAALPHPEHTPKATVRVVGDPNITIPEEAVEAGAKALTEITHRPWADCLPATREVLRRNARVPLEAAAPLIAAAELERLAEEVAWSVPQAHLIADRIQELRVGSLTHKNGEADA